MTQDWKTSPVVHCLAEFVDCYLAKNPDLVTRFDPDWRSHCELGTPFEVSGEQMIKWRPVQRAAEVDGDFNGLENALECRIHPDIKAYYGAYWSSSLSAVAPAGPLSLILLWNEDDVDRLIENMIGHALEKRRRRQPLTIFFATTTADSERFLSIDNASGAVLLEEPGRKPVQQVASSLPVFLKTLAPQEESAFG